MTAPDVAELLGMDVPLREKVLWSMLYESTARAEVVLTLDLSDLDTVNRCTTVTGKGGARDVIYRQSCTARMPPRLIEGRRRPAVSHRPQGQPPVAKKDVDPGTCRTRLSYRRATTLLEEHTTEMGRGHSRCASCAIPLDRRDREGRVHPYVDSVGRTHLVAQPHQVRECVRRGVAPLAHRDRPYRTAL
ncbi:hypothetical protein IFM12275_24410 [Nocardia sputorum]|uniref:hypothetical protein n=1 Tax=Nocardia sputorum TaxID=2984338 RepID=UPI0024939CAE|nr:hypothetical protein [Nocardia sputorum]BDT92465.1 hypothetical protein IFM12275_24410 [Nocardia sputorum]